MDDLILEKTIISKNRVTFYFNPRGCLKEYFISNTMFVEYDCSVEEVPTSILNIAFVSSVLPLMWLTDTTLWVDELDRTFYDAVQRIKIAYQELYPHVKLGGILVAARPRYNTYTPERESMLLFGGGIDAHVSFLRIKEMHPTLCNIQGWCGGSKEKEMQDAADADKRDISDFAEKQGVPFSFIKSNFAALVKNNVFQKKIGKKLGDSWWHGFQHSMSFISIAIPLAYMSKIRNIYIASSFAIGRPGKCASYATTDIEFKFADCGGCVHDAFELSRQDKVRCLVKFQKASGLPYPVRVCSFNDKNCCECEKCFRTVLEIVAEDGDVHNFGFPIEGSLKDYYQNVMYRKLYGFGVKGEKKKHWPDSIRRMQENYNNLHEKEFVDWFLQYDFEGEKRKALRRYYQENFFSILKRKLHLSK